VLNTFPNDLSPYEGVGSIYSTSDDLLRWLEAVRTERLYPISQQSYPYGWGRRRYFDRPALEQSGLFNGFSSTILTFPAEKLDVVCLLNIQTGFFNSCGKDIAAIIFRAPYKVSEKLQYVAVAPAQTEKFLGTYRARPDLAFRILRDGKDLYYYFVDNPKEKFYLGTFTRRVV
jgi:CubicO group peptidase (beta-lactamase class C family)